MRLSSEGEGDRMGASKFDRRTGCRRARCGRAALILALIACAPLPAGAQAHTSSATGGGTRLTYEFKAGQVRTYRVSALFTGHIPPFVQPGSPPVTLLAKLTYVATVKKADATGADVDFAVAAADVSLLEKPPGPDGKIDPNSVTPFPLPLEQVQQVLDVTARIRPDGSVEHVTGAASDSVRLHVGFDLQKLFMLITPVVFPARAVHANDEWSFDDGVLGHNPGSTTYQARLLSIDRGRKQVAFRVGQTAVANVDTKLDKAGNAAASPSAAVGTLKGKVDVRGNLTFVGPRSQGGSPAAGQEDAAWLSAGTMDMVALLEQDRDKPDPTQPELPLKSTIDVKAHLVVRLDKTPASAARGGQGPASLRGGG